MVLLSVPGGRTLAGSRLANCLLSMECLGDTKSRGRGENFLFQTYDHSGAFRLCCSAPAA